MKSLLWFILSTALMQSPQFAHGAFAISAMPAKIVVYHINDSLQSNIPIDTEWVLKNYSDKISINDGGRIRTIVNQRAGMNAHRDRNGADVRWVIVELDSRGKPLQIIGFDKFFARAIEGGEGYSVSGIVPVKFRSLLACIPLSDIR